MELACGRLKVTIEIQVVGFNWSVITYMASCTRSGVALYRQLLRRLEALPEKPRLYYRHRIRQVSAG